MHDICMATKTISLEIDAYEKLRQAKQSDRESFSSVVRRARWDHGTPTAKEILEGLRAAASTRPEILLSDPDLDRLARRRRTGRRKTRWEER
jgi:hypothetical protein